MSFRIDTYDEHCPVLRIKLGDRDISFTVRDVSPAAHVWLGEVLERQITELVDLRVRQALAAHKAALRELLGCSK